MKSLVQVSSIKLHLVLQAIQCRGRLEKHFYSANVAQAKADNDASAPRQGIDLTGRELADPVALVSPLMMWGRSLSQIYLSHEEDIPCCLKSLHTHVSKEEVGAGRMHPIDAASRKPRKKKPEDDAGKPVPCKSLASRSWQEYLDLEDDERDGRWKMDAVIGRVGRSACSCFCTVPHASIRAH